MKTKHVIHKVYLELDTTSLDQAHHIKDNITDFLHTELLPELEKKIEQLDANMEDFAVQFSEVKLEIDADNVTLDATIKEKIKYAFEEQLLEKVNSIATHKHHDTSDPSTPYSKPFKTKEAHALETFIAFLETGTNPWWNADQSIATLFEAPVFKRIISSPEFSKKIQGILKRSLVLKRVVKQLKLEEVHMVILQLCKDLNIKLTFTSELLKIIKLFSVSMQQQLMKQLVELIINKKSIPKNTLIQLLTQALSKAPIKHMKEKDRALLKRLAKDTPEAAKIEIILEEKTTEPQEKQIDKLHSKSEEDGIIVNNAGLVLTHPFLKHFFTHCELLDEKQQLKDPEMAVHLLHYLATGNTQQPESELAFEKFICAIPINQPITREIEITDAHKEHAKKMLEAVNSNWSAMKSSSVELLQHEFLQRPGKLNISDFGINITIERKTHDILLDKLSWGIGLIKLPWRSDFIYVNW